MKFQLKKSFQIESARFLSQLPKQHPCSRMHGHSFHITFTFVGPLQEKLDWLIDYHELEQKIRPILALLDHQTLNNVPGLENPTTEILSKWLFEHVRKEIPELTQVTVKETQDTECTYPVL